MSWNMDPQWASALPPDGGLVHYMAMPTKDRLPEFKRDPGRGPRVLLRRHARRAADPRGATGRPGGRQAGDAEPPTRAGTPRGSLSSATRRWPATRCPASAAAGRFSRPNGSPTASRRRCAARSRSARPRRYRGRHRAELRGHALLIHNYATGRRFKPLERLLFAAGARDERVAIAIDHFVTRSAKPGRTLGAALPRAIAVNTRHALGLGAPAGPTTAAAGGRVSAG